MTTLRFLFAGNTNCMPFRYAREIKRQGHDVMFIIDQPRSLPLHRPEALFPEIPYPYPDWILELGWTPRNTTFLLPDRRLDRLLEMVNQQAFDAVVLCGYWIRIAGRIDHGPELIALLAGSDLDVLTDRRAALLGRHARNPIKDLASRLMLFWGAEAQRQGLRRAGLVNYYPEGINPEGDRLLKEVMGRRPYARLQTRGLSVDLVPYSEPSDRRGNAVRLFSPTRFLWRQPLPAGFSPLENKGNDVMLHGIARFVRQSGIEPRIDLVEKGPDVAATKDLAEHLGISALITWHAEMSYNELFQLMRDADIVFDQFGPHWLGAGAADAMLMGRAVIGNGRPEIFTPLLGEPLALCHATDESGVAEWLRLLVNDPEERRRRGLLGRACIERNLNSVDTASALIRHVRERAAARRGPGDDRSDRVRA